jgi:hypothetical protein
MKNIKNIFFPILFFSASVLYGQVPFGYVLAKTSVTAPISNTGTVAYQWVASNHTTKDGNFFILENVPSHYVLQSITVNPSVSSALPLNPALPLSGPAPITIGPFSIAANSSVTFQVTGLIRDNPTRGKNQTFAGETFSLLSDSQLSGKSRKISSSVYSREITATPTPSATPVPKRGLIQSVVAAPNISNGIQPINFILNLGSPAMVNLSLFTVTGERVFNTQAQGNQGVTTLVWDVKNTARRQVSSGMYIFVLQVAGAGAEETRTGKVLIIH